MFEVWHVMDIGTPLSQVADRARRAERLGFDVLALPDIVHDGLMAAAIACQATRRIEIATSALIAFPRSPMIVAVATWDLQESSGGRFRLGLGPQVRGNIVGRFSTPWSPPAPRMREYVGALRAIFDCWQNGIPLDFEGEHYHFNRMQAYTSPPPIDAPNIPIYLAGIGRHMTALAGECADGLFTHPTNSSPRFLREWALPHLERGRARRPRGKRAGVVINPLCATGRSAQEIEQQREAHRALLAVLYSTPPYWPSLQLFEWHEVGEALNQRVREGRWEEMTDLISDEMLDALVPTAPLSELAGLLTGLYSDLGDAITLAMPEDPGLDEELAKVIAGLKGGA